MLQSYHYTLGRVISNPQIRTGKNRKNFQTAYVELLGGMRASAIAAVNIDLSIGTYVGVKISSNGAGQSTYNVLLLDEDAQTMVLDAASYIEETSNISTDDECEIENNCSSEMDDADLLPF